MPTPNLIQQQRQILHELRQAKEQYIKSTNEISNRYKQETAYAETNLTTIRQQMTQSIEEFRKIFKIAETQVASESKDTSVTIQQTSKVTINPHDKSKIVPFQEIQNQIAVISPVFYLVRHIWQQRKHISFG